MIFTLLFVIQFIQSSVAVECKSNQYIDIAETCQNCSLHCTSCFDSKSCQRCEDAYEMARNAEGNYFCSPCVENCKKCSLGVCYECAKFYELKEVDENGVKKFKCEAIKDNSKTVILILGIIVAVVVVVIAVDILVCFILNKRNKN